MNLTRPRLAALAGVLGLVVLTGCSGGASGSASAAGDNAPAGSLSDRSAADPEAATAQAYKANGSADQTAVVEQKAVIKKGDISLHTSDPQQVRDRVDQLLTRLHGSLDDEQTVYDTSGRIKESQLVLRVPVATFGTAMDALEHLGTVVHSSSSGTDVTTQVIDVQQRLRTLRISLRDLNSFQQHAATIDQLLRFENAITQRRGEYQSLKAQRDHLVNQTSMSTIDLDVSVPPAHATPAEHGRPRGVPDRSAARVDGPQRHRRGRADGPGCGAPLRPAAGRDRPACVVVATAPRTRRTGDPGRGGFRRVSAGLSSPARTP